eukprot:TRINITY_DN2049_c0_g1_i2.p1 TRINITY_DN2049_c0_g1~~TRINITY_DN2049_c0_g1_i2.p1  ORF type:complete len:171 (-),score=37.88 TRINITY_DN2049_c0_g1_i2:564-1076(-)
MSSISVKYLTQLEAQQLDEDLMGASAAYSIEQLMELAGLSVACAVRQQLPPSTHRRIVVVAGPGNNGGDGLVAARHLKLFGYEPLVVYPKRPDKPLFKALVRQCEAFGLPLTDALPQPFDADVVLDAIFGFSFKGDLRPPFDSLLAVRTRLDRQHRLCSVSMHGCVCLCG